MAYAPYENPEIAISVVLPHLNDESSKPNQTIAKEVLEAYMEMYKNKICKVELLYKFAKSSQMTKNGMIFKSKKSLGKINY